MPKVGITPLASSPGAAGDQIRAVSRRARGFDKSAGNSLALARALPSMHGFREFVEAGGLMSYGANFPDMFRRGADLVDKILHGAKPGEIPVEQPTRFDLVINIKTAGALGVEIPDRLIALANEVIE